MRIKMIKVIIHDVQVRHDGIEWYVVLVDNTFKSEDTREVWIPVNQWIRISRMLDELYTDLED